MKNEMTALTLLGAALALSLASPARAKNYRLDGTPDYGIAKQFRYEREKALASGERSMITERALNTVRVKTSNGLAATERAIRESRFEAVRTVGFDRINNVRIRALRDGGYARQRPSAIKARDSTSDRARTEARRNGDEKADKLLARAEVT